MAQAWLERFLPEALRAFLYLKQAGYKPYHEFKSIKEARKTMAVWTKELAGRFDDYRGSVTEMRVPSPHVAAGLSALVYHPEGLPHNAPMLVNFHGGGKVVGCKEERDTTCRMIAHAAKCIIVNAEYRLAPEHKFPAQGQDALTVTTWVRDNKQLLGGSHRSSLGVCGDSSGATLASWVCHQMTGIDYQVLVYPACYGSGETKSFQEFARAPGLNRKDCAWFTRLTYSNMEDMLSMRAAQQPKMEGVPPALFVVAEIDPLRDDSYVYAKKLEASGIPAEVLQVDGVPHGFFAFPGYYKKSCTKAYGRVVEFIQRQHARTLQKFPSSTVHVSKY